MINENALRDVLVILAETHRDQYALLMELGCEIAALKETVRVLDPTFAEVFEERVKQAAQAVARKKETSIAGYDNLVQKLKAGLAA